MTYRWLTLTLIVAGLATPVLAATGVVRTMKSWKSDTRAIEAMVSGRAAYNEAATKAALEDYANGATRIAASINGHSAQARDYKGRFVSFAIDAQSAVAVAGQSQAVQAAYGRLTSQCESCHNAYRQD